MKKLTMLMALTVVAMVSMSQNKTGTIATDYTMLTTPFSFNSNDTIDANDTFYIDVTSKQKYPNKQEVFYRIDSLSGAPNITVTLQGKVFPGDAYATLGTPLTWDSELDTANYVVTTASNNQYFRLMFVANGTTQHSKVIDVKFKNPFTGGQLAVDAITDGTATFTDGALTGATTGAFSGAVTVGGTLGITGATTATGAIAANGGLALPSQSPVIWATGGSVDAVASGTDAAATNGDRFWTEIQIPYNVTLTGIAYLVGSVGATDSVVVQLCNSSGVQVATSRSVGGAATIVGTAAEFQSVAFTAPYIAVAGKYFVALQFNGTTAKFRTYLIPGSKFIAGTAGGVWGTAAGITPGTTFTAGKGPIFMTY